jgi:hypothetical protein
MHTVVETPSYLAKAESILGKQGMEEVVKAVAANPEMGEVMQGTGGFRKFRASRPGMGKRVGARIVSIYRNEDFPVFLITVFAKNEQGNLSKAERNALKVRADEIFKSYGAQ